jgi:hypothetical protein
MFCPAALAELVHRHCRMSALWSSNRDAKAHSKVLLSCVFKPLSLEGGEDPNLSELRQGLRSLRNRRLQSAALFKTVRQELQRKDNSHLAAGASRADEALLRAPRGQSSGSVAQEMGNGARANHRASRWFLCRMRRHQSSLAPRRLHRGIARKPVSTPATLRLRQSTQRRVPTALRESSLRAHAYRRDRGNNHHAVAGGAHV